MVINSLGTPTTITTNANALIGASDLNNQPTEFFKGNIDELRIWDTIIGPNHSSTSSKELKGNEPHLIGYYKFDHSNSTCDVLDHSPSGNHGSRQGNLGTNNLPQYTTDVPVMTPETPPAIANCDFISISENKIAKMELYPNPSNGRFSISLKHDEPTTISITNMHGALVYQEKFKGSQHLVNCNLPVGQYIVSVSQASANYSAKLSLH